MIYFRSILFYLGEAVSTIPFLLISLVALPASPQRRSKLIAGWAHFVTWWLKLTCGLSHQIEGAANIPQDPCVFACKHSSTWETIATQTFLPPLAWVLKKELLRIPVFGWGLWATRPIAIDRSDREGALDQVVRQGVDKLREGRHVLIFPEGTRIQHGVASRYKKGAAKLARAGKVEIIPIAHDAGKYWSKQSPWIRPGTIRCIIGEPMALADKSDIEITRDIKSWVESQGI